MKSYKMSGMIVAALAIVGCTSATIAEPSACDMQSASFTLPTMPTIPAQYNSVATCSEYHLNVPPASTSTSVDVSDAVSKLNNVANNVSVGVNSFTIDNSDGEFNWVGSVDVQASTQSLPSMTLASYVSPVGGPGPTLNAKVVMSGDNVLKYLGSGPVSLTITLQAQNVSACQAMVLETLPKNVSSSVNLCVSAQGTVNKSL